jgi:hypothetical protein
MTGTEGRTEVYLMLNLNTRWGWVVNTMPQLLHPWEGAWEPTVKEVGWVPVQVWMGMENRKSLVPARIQTLNYPAHSESLH